MDTVDVIRTLKEYYGKDLNETQVRVYLDTLSDISPSLLNEAATRLIKDGHAFMPRVSELRQKVAEIKGSGWNEPDPQLDYWRAMAAFALVLRGYLPETILDRPQYQAYFKSKDELGATVTATSEENFQNG